MKEFNHIITNSESKYVYVAQERNKGAQGSYQLGKEIKSYFFDNQIVEEVDSNKDFSTYVINEEYKTVISKKIQELINREDNNVDIVFTLKKDGKFDIRKSANKKNAWFKDLYEILVSGDIFFVKVDISEKIIEFDVKQKYNNDISKLDNRSRQKIYYGAPGTGKSYFLKNDSILFGNNVRRVTFHPNMMYGDFVGNYKPFPVTSNGHKSDKSSKITYKYVVGPFIKTLIDSIKNPNEAFLLIIEEFNRADVSAVFGDMFQLLDRDESGESEYPVDISEDLQLYLDEALFENTNIDIEFRESIKNKLTSGLIIPSNMFIWGSMNSADQGVMPMDTAFKRRWDFEYFPINFAFDKELFDSFGQILLGENFKIKWNDFREAINDKLTLLNVAEDKLLGPYFISKSTLLKSDEEVTRIFKNKVLMYLFEDIGTQYRKSLFDVSQLRLSTILEEFDFKGEKIFKDIRDLSDKKIAISNVSSDIL